MSMVFDQNGGEVNEKKSDAFILCIVTRVAASTRTQQAQNQFTRHFTGVMPSYAKVRSNLCDLERRKPGPKENSTSASLSPRKRNTDN